MNDALDAGHSAAQTEALGEQNDLPNPITNTIPEADAKPEAKAKPEPKLSSEEKRSKSVSDAIDKALKDGDGDGVKPEAKPDAKADAKPDAKADPAPKDGAKPDAALDDAAKAKAETDAAKPAPKPSAYREPPSGFDDAAKAEWEAVPESVRGAVHRRSQEMERGIEKYRAAAQEYEPVRQFAEMAKQSGTTLDQALQRYVGIEQQLRQDPMGGLQAVVANMGLKKQDGSPVTLRDIAASIMGQTPDQAASRQEATINRLTQQVQSLTQQLGGFSKHVEQQQEQAKVSSAQSAWDTFQKAPEYSRAKELEPQIAEFLRKYPAPNMPVGERLRDAYNWAVAQNPSVAHTDSPPLVQTQTPPTPNPAGQKSISGAPGGNDAKTVSRTINRSAAIDKAMRAAGI